MPPIVRFAPSRTTSLEVILMQYISALFNIFWLSTYSPGEEIEVQEFICVVAPETDASIKIGMIEKTTEEKTLCKIPREIDKFLFKVFL
ncbi:MAG: hypothetical protein PHH85_01285 [Candidatus Methanoperedens sp.]|nr:hypothetical protein [Candidatus Methanoperedens sp.]